MADNWIYCNDLTDDRDSQNNEKTEEASTKHKYTLSDVLVTLPFICGSFSVGTYFSVIVPFFPQQVCVTAMSQ